MALSRDELIKALTDVARSRPTELPPMVRGTVYVPTIERQTIAPGAKTVRKGGL